MSPELYTIYYAKLYPSTAGSSPLPYASNFCCPLLSLSMLCLVLHDVIFLIMFWFSSWSYNLYLPYCVFNDPSVVIHSGSVPSPFPFHSHDFSLSVTMVLCLMMVFQSLSFSLRLRFTYPLLIGLFQASLVMLLLETMLGICVSLFVKHTGGRLLFRLMESCPSGKILNHECKRIKQLTILLRKSLSDCFETFSPHAVDCIFFLV